MATDARGGAQGLNPVLTVEKYSEITALVPDDPERYTGIMGSAGRGLPRLGLSAAMAGSDQVEMTPFESKSGMGDYRSQVTRGPSRGGDDQGTE